MALFKSAAAIESAIKINLTFLVITTAAAFFSGYQAADSASLSFQVSEDVIAEHHNIGRLALFLVLPAAALRFIASGAKHARAIFFTLYYASLVSLCALIILAGFKGGQLVFQYGAGVSLHQDDQNSSP
ncbi:MAG: hypothetical protein J5J00_15130 [Deltaproteobacteria bacterium]|nr:hypothetical protein [Deltaproteobacteria bacterium]